MNGNNRNKTKFSGQYNGIETINEFKYEQIRSSTTQYFRSTHLKQSLILMLLIFFVGSGFAAADNPLIPEVVESYANEIGVNHEEAARRLRLVDDLSDLDTELAQRDWQTFAGLWIEHGPEPKAVVQFVGQSSHRRSALEHRLGMPVEIRSVKYTLKELEHQQNDLAQLLQVIGIPGDSEIDLKNNRVALYVEDRSALLSALDIHKKHLDRAIYVEEVDALAEDHAEIYAGLSLSTCTAGWSVKNKDGVLGIATSGHCGDSQKYSSVSLPFKSEAWGGACDVQWHGDSIYTAVPKFIQTAPQYVKNVTGTRSRSAQVINEYVCKYGKTTGLTCGYIKSKTFSSSTQPNGTATFIRVSNPGLTLSQGGDSGGPWFSATNAYGINKGSVNTVDAYYMAIDYVASCLGLTVLVK